MSLYADIIRRPQLPDEEFEGAIAGIEQSLRAIEDEPQRKLMIELRRRCYDAPWGLPTEGTLEEIARITANSVRAHYDRCLRPNGAILGIAGRVEIPEMLDLIGDKFGDWAMKPDSSMVTGPRGERIGHINHDSTQTHIGIGYDAIEYAHPDYYKAWAAVGVLSGGMSAALHRGSRASWLMLFGQRIAQQFEARRASSLLRRHNRGTCAGNPRRDAA